MTLARYLTQVLTALSRISYGPLVFPCLYREAMHLQCFSPTLYVKNGDYLWCALFRKFLKIEV